MKKNWYRIENAAADEATICIYDEISAWGISAQSFCSDLAGVKASTINLHINSPGGNVFDGITIGNALQAHAATVNVVIDGLAASIASIIAMAGDKISMAKNAMMMIHNAWGGCCGNSSDMLKMADTLDKIDSTLVDTYAARTGCGKRAVKQMMNDETWMTADEAKAKGFCDCVGTDGAAKASFDLSKFHNTPPMALVTFGAKANQEPATEREIEALLRDAGVSIAKAKAAVAAIRAEPVRDAEGSAEDLAKQFLMEIETVNFISQVSN